VNTILGPGVTFVPGTEASSAEPCPRPVGRDVHERRVGAGESDPDRHPAHHSKAADAVGPNDNGSVPETLGGGGFTDDMTTDLGLPGDDDLTALAGFSTYDATVLGFSFTTARQGDLTFRFVFASEEYIDWVNTQYNDVFAFHLDGENLAVLPDGGTPVRSP
jgi:hypothetical protein